MVKKVEIIDKSQEKECYECEGTGAHEIFEKGVFATGIFRNCKKCNGTGKYKQDSYLLITTQPNGQKIAFDVDNGGK